MVTILRPGDSRDIMAARFEIQKEDIFHLKNLYEWMHDYLVHEEWYDVQPAKDDKFEHMYWDKTKHDGSKEHRIWWRLQKTPFENTYFRYVFIINFRNLYSRKLEVVHKGQKASTWRGELTLQMEAWLQLDYKNQWVNHWLLKHFHPLYHKRIYKERWWKHKKDLWDEAYKFSGWIKKYLDMKIPFDRPHIFHQEGGIGPNPTVEGFDFEKK